jgi:hypothetical protein
MSAIEHSDYRVDVHETPIHGRVLEIALAPSQGSDSWNRLHKELAQEVDRERPQSLVIDLRELDSPCGTPLIWALLGATAAMRKLGQDRRTRIVATGPIAETVARDIKLSRREAEFGAIVYPDPEAALNEPVAKDWIAYIEAEVAAACREKGWRHQIRRKWSARERPVSESGVDDYEWKLIPRDRARESEAPPPTVTPAPSLPSQAGPNEFEEGIYFVLGFDSVRRTFVLQHDTSHCGVLGDHWCTSTYTEIHLPDEWPTAHEVEPRVMVAGYFVIVPPSQFESDEPGDRLPPPGLLRRFLLDLTSRHEPNYFSST